MAKCCVAYWNPLYPLNAGLWSEGPGMGGLVAELVLSRDAATGDYTKLTRISPAADMLHFECKVHDYPEEIFVVSGSLYDASCDLWLEQGHYVCRPPGAVHGPFNAGKDGCILLELSAGQADKI